MSKKQRLDQLVVQRGLAESRQRAQALILAGKVLVNGEPSTKAGTQIPTDATLELKGGALKYVSRGGLKLEGALDHFALDVKGLLALDVGASTGGFTDCLLQRGAAHVIGVDVGYGQLAWKLRQDARVTCLERINARRLDPMQLQRALPDPSLWPPKLAVIDVSFISLTLVLPALVLVLPAATPVVTLIKPQFEAGRREVGKGGVVRDTESRQRAIDRVLDWARETAWSVVDGLDSSVPGPKGNVEYLALLRTPTAPRA
ncbi:MAG: TlyA family RNA methyltransferase [Deltaproteobacteria bacterium]|nr:TlyA family RNA methyltransferase [Deltaproteobacteria bacterium]